MVYFSQLRDVLPQNCLAYLRLRSIWATKGKYPKEILRRYLEDIGRSSARPGKEKTSNDFIAWMEVFTCKCGWLLYSPCTLPCGHTVCKLCFTKSKYCPHCGEESENYILNTTLDGLLEQWYPVFYKSSTMKGKAFAFIKDKHFKKAIELLDEALELVSNDFTALNMRSEAYHGLKIAKQCFKDAKRSCEINDTCGESFFRLGEAYAILNKLDDSVEAFNKSLELEPDDGDLNARVVESLDQLLSMSPGSEINLSDDDSDLDGCKDMLHNVKERPEEKDSITKPIKLVTSKDEGLSSEREVISPLQGTSQGQKSAECSHKEVTKISGTTEEKPVKNVDNNLISLASSCSSKKRQRELSPRALERKRGKIDCNQVPQLEDFECKLCFCLLFHPVTTACGHVFCKKCLERCVDYNPSCPICRRKLSCMESSGVGNVTEVIQNAITHFFPEEVNERQRKHEARMALMSRVGEDEDVEVPIFACTMALPGIQCPLHVFEPKYRMMLRECLESGSYKFGMCKADKEGGFFDYGTIVEVRHVRYLPDGRSIIDTVGVRRFKVNGKCLKEGVSYAKVEYFEDDKDICANEEEVAQLFNKCRATYDTLSTYIGNLHPSQQECISNALGPLPRPQEQDPRDCPNGEPWVWWALCALPLTDNAKAMMFKSRSVLDRVTILQRFLNILVRHRLQAGNRS